jgi:O-antigen ligase
MEGLGKNIYNTLNQKSLFNAPLSRTILWTSENRINGLIGDGDSHGMFMSLIFLLSLSLFFISKSKRGKSLSLIVMFTSLFNIIGAASRGAVLGFVTALIIFWSLIELSKKWLILASIVTLSLIFFFSMIILIPDLNIERFYNPKLEAQKTVGLRLNNLAIGLKMVGEHPMIGSGPDGFMLNYLRYARLIPGTRRIPTKPLNTYIQALVEYGVVGLTAFLFLLFLMIKHFIQLLKNAKGIDRYMIGIIFSVLCGYCVFINTTGFFVDQIYWLLIALCGVTITIYKSNFNTNH